ncbi:hypothetical protein ZEAMMB73_Zm00001d051515 [Zea mays]|uniref:Uncharacterized protein n=1 Tax=Zea mays TaxID=4577 RepID=K7U382_MAIZE|nr:hypothetical protein ZEAMMB73_Zm00001d051515 [Zea mays]
MRELSTVSYQAAAEMLGSVKVCSRWHLLNRICSLTFAATARGCRRLRPTAGGSSNGRWAALQIKLSTIECPCEVHSKVEEHPGLPA